MSSLLEYLSDCQPKVRSDLMSFLNITSNELSQEMALLREAGLNIQEENEVYQFGARNALVKSANNFRPHFHLIPCIIIEPFLQQMNL